MKKLALWRCKEMRMIHTYEKNGLYIVLDVESGTVLTVDRITYDVLPYYGKLTACQISEILNGKYSTGAVAGVFADLHELKEQGLIFTEGDYDPGFYRNNHLIKALCLHVAHDCNLKCEYCFAGQGDFQGERSLMSLDTGKQAIDFLIDHSGGRKHLEIDFFGGEPLMNFDVVRDLVDYARDQGAKKDKIFKFTMTTNGVLLDEAARIYLNENMDNVVLSLDGRPEVNDRMRKTVNDKASYPLIIDNIVAMAKMREGVKDYYIRGTYTKHNLDFAKDVEFLANEGFGSISVEPVVGEKGQDYAITEEDIPTIVGEYDRLAKNYLSRQKTGKGYNFFHFNIDLEAGPCVYKRLSGCGAGRDYIAVTPEGDIFPCHQFVGNEDFKMGHVNEGIQHPEVSESFKAANLLEKPACQDCWCKYFCGGGCHANAYNFNQSLMEPYSVACELERARVENAIMIQIMAEAEAAKITALK